MPDYILLVEDDDAVVFIAELMFGDLESSLSFQTVTNGMEAVQFLAKCQGQFPKLIILDINMPLMNGFEFLKWLRENDYEGRTKIAMCTSSIREEDRRTCLEFSDVCDYIEKPLNRDKLKMVLQKSL